MLIRIHIEIDGPIECDSPEQAIALLQQLRDHAAPRLTDPPRLAVEEPASATAPSRCHRAVTGDCEGELAHQRCALAGCDWSTARCKAHGGRTGARAHLRAHYRDRHPGLKLPGAQHSPAAPHDPPPKRHVQVVTDPPMPRPEPDPSTKASRERVAGSLL